MGSGRLVGKLSNPMAAELDIDRERRVRKADMAMWRGRDGPSNNIGAGSGWIFGEDFTDGAEVVIEACGGVEASLEDAERSSSLLDSPSRLGASKISSILKSRGVWVSSRG